MFKQDLKFMVELAKQAGEILMSYFKKELTRSIKSGPHDFATEADFAAEKLIISAIKDNYPDDAIIAEESGKHIKENAEYTWIVDPLDGTRNFAHQDSNFGVMIARVRGDDIQQAVIFNPKQKILAYAVKGEGTKLNHQPLKIKSFSTNKPIISADPYAALRDAGFTVIDTGSMSGNVVTVLSQHLSAYVSYASSVWDITPPALMLAEAGYKVTQLNGQPFVWQSGERGFMAAVPSLYQQLFQVINKK